MRITYITISLLFLSYIVASALIIPFTVDEVSTYIEFVQQTSLWNTITTAHPTANNHLLNSLLTRFFAQFSVHEFSLRLPNILSFFLYLYGAYTLATSLFTNKLEQLCFFIALHADNYLLHCFNYSRGYGLSMSFMICSIAGLISFFKETRFNKRKIHIVLLTIVLAVYASFTTLFACMAVMITAAYAIYQKQETKNIRSFVRSISLPFLYFLILAALCAYPIWRLIMQDELYYGGSEGFLKDTMTTVSEDMLYTYVYAGTSCASVIAVCSFIAISLMVALFSFIRHKGKESYYYVGPFILLFCLVAVNAQHYAMDSKFIIHRTAVYLHPLIIITVFSAIALFGKRFITVKKITIIAITFIMVFFLVRGLSFKPNVESWPDVHTKEVLKFIVNDAKPTPQHKVKLYVYDDVSNSFRYYVETYYSNIVEQSPWRVRDFSKLDLDTFQYLFIRTTDDFKSKPHFKPILEFPDTYIVYKKKQ